MKQRRISTMVGLFVYMVAQALAQECTGKVTDSSGNPVVFAEVLLMNRQDSAFIVGTVTNSTGSYRMKCNEPMNHLMVKASRPTFKMDAGALTAKIENTTLSHLGNASDVLAQLPFVLSSDGKLSVFGRGEPVIYINNNNNRMRNQEELSKLKSDQIKDIKVIVNPGAEYDATAGTVIKITTFRPIDEGLSGMVQGMAHQKRNFGHTEGTSVNYRTGELDVFVYGYNSVSKTEQHQRTVM